MQKAVVFAIVAPALYALANVLMEYKFSKFNNLTILIVCYSVVITLAIVMRALTKTADTSYDFPTGDALWLMLLLGVVFFAADYFFVGAYTNGGDLLTITILTILFPVFASIFKFTGSFFIRDMTFTPPNLWQIGGYLLAAIAVIMVVKGNPTPP